MYCGALPFPCHTISALEACSRRGANTNTNTFAQMHVYLTFILPYLTLASLLKIIPTLYRTLTSLLLCPPCEKFCLLNPEK